MGYAANCGWFVTDKKESIERPTTASALHRAASMVPLAEKTSPPCVKIFLSNNHFGEISPKYKLTITLEDGMLIEVGKSMGFSWVFRVEVKPRSALASGSAGFWFDN